MKHRKVKKIAAAGAAIRCRARNGMNWVGVTQATR
jgi:hypothetical protein